MPKRLAVFVGAGASFDLMGANASKVQKEFRPPLTSEIFGQERFLDILDTCPGARALASTIGIRVRGGEPLEEVLRALRDESSPHIRRQYRQVPVYLQRLFLAVSVNYTKEPVNYTHLLNSILASDYDEVLIVTTNYDTFLEQAIQSVTLRRIKTLDDYISDSRLQLVKLHGSIDWGWPIEGGPSTVGNVADLVEFLDSCDPDVRLGTEVLKMANPGKVRHPTGRLVYPALAVPVHGKYEHICPESHVDAARSFLKDTRDLIVLGVSGKDRDVNDLIALSDCRRIAVVSKSNPTAVLETLQKSALDLLRAAAVPVKGGFSAFLTRGQLDQFLTEL